MPDSILMVKEFHDIFACAAPDRAQLPPISDEAQASLDEVAAEMGRLAKFCWDRAAECTARGLPPEEQLVWARLQLVQEELSELADALAHRDIVAVFDALLDLQYVVDGGFLAFGLGAAKAEGFREVHESNMSKLGADGRPIINEAGRVVKGPNYYRPNLRAILMRRYPAVFDGSPAGQKLADPEK